jgi:hypothetical protein
VIDGDAGTSDEAPELAPSWPPETWLSPTKLKGYTNCPYRVRLQYVDKLPYEQPFSLFLTQGNIAHNLLAEAARFIRGGQQLRTRDDMFERAIRRMPPEEFPSAEALVAGVEQILRWVDYGISYIDRTAKFLNIEGKGRRGIPWQPEGTRLTISTRPDLILLRTDADGERFVEIIDYKTGAKWVDDLPPIVMRYVFKELFQRLAEDTLSLRMQFTYVYLEHRDTEVIELSPEYCLTAWEHVTGTIGRLMAEREWPAQPSHLCNYCPYYRAPCTAPDEMENDKEPF